MGARGSASGSGNSKCVKRRDRPRSTRNYRPRFEMHGQTDTEIKLWAPRPGEARCLFLLTPCKGVNYRLPPRSTSNFFPATQSTKALKQMFKIKLCLGPCNRLQLVSLSWMIRDRSSARKPPLILTICLIIT